MLMMPHIVIDTNVLVAALISRQGKAYRLFADIGMGRFEIVISTPLVLEYEEVFKRLLGTKIMLSEQDIDIVLDYICGNAHHQRIYYLWRPLLSDPGDDMLLELAVNAQCDFIITYNLGDFAESERFGIRPILPVDLSENY
jgi:putative PIN family toxin of toxin-antitoxin system